MFWCSKEMSHWRQHMFWLRNKKNLLYTLLQRLIYEPTPDILVHIALCVCLCLTFVIWRWGHSLKSHLKDRWSRGMNLQPLFTRLVTYPLHHSSSPYSHYRETKAQKSLGKCTGLAEPLLLAYSKYECRSGFKGTIFDMICTHAPYKHT